MKRDPIPPHPGDRARARRLGCLILLAVVAVQLVAAAILVAEYA